MMIETDLAAPFQKNETHKEKITIEKTQTTIMLHYEFIMIRIHSALWPKMDSY